MGNNDITSYLSNLADNDPEWKRWDCFEKYLTELKNHELVKNIFRHYNPEMKSKLLTHIFVQNLEGFIKINDRDSLRALLSYLHILKKLTPDQLNFYLDQLNKNFCLIFAEY